MDARDEEPRDEVPVAWLEQRQALREAREEQRFQARVDEGFRRRRHTQAVRTVIRVGVPVAVTGAGYYADRAAHPATGALPFLLVVWLIAGFTLARALDGFVERRGANGGRGPRTGRARARRRRRTRG